MSMLGDAPAQHPAEAWAFIERFAQTALAVDKKAIRAVLADIEAALVDDTAMLRDDADLIQLVVRHQELGIHLYGLIGTCNTVREMMREHYRCWPEWKGPGANEAPLVEEP